MHYIHYHGKITPRGVQNIETLLADAWKNLGVKEVTLCICTSGGDVTSGIGLYNYIQMLPIKVHTHATGMCDSIGATIFMAGEHRTANPIACFTTHAAKYVEGPNTGKTAPNTTLLSAPFKSKLEWDETKISTYFSENDVRLSPQQALNEKILHKIFELNVSNTDTLVNVSIPDL